MSFDLTPICPARIVHFWDRNADGAFTVSDIWRLLGDVLSLPADLLIALTLSDGGAPARFLELSCASMGSPGATTVGVIIWILALFGSARAALDS